MTHLKSILPLLGANEAPHFVSGRVPAEIGHLLSTEKSKYLPILYLDRMSFRIKDLIEVADSLLLLLFSSRSRRRSRRWR